MKTVKTTFDLPAKTHLRLKAMAARLGINARELVVEGIELALARYDSAGDREELTRRAQAARERIRGGLFDGPSDLSETYESRLLIAAEPYPPHKP